ncbi:MAG: hypothetical protein O2800_00705 [Planctomycetota bacterium]|nr:hypothetical protein [Planctomycetota bacterium]
MTMQPPESALSSEDQRILDLLVESNWDPALSSDASDADRALAASMMQQLTALDAMEVATPEEALVDVTMARIHRAEEQRLARMLLEPTPSKGRGIRIPDFITVAALLLVGIAILFPVTSRIRANAETAACASNFGELFQGLDCYASEHNGYSPIAASMASLFDFPAPDGRAPSQEHIEEGTAATLNTLESKGYCHGRCTKCCGRNPIAMRVPLHRSHLILSFVANTPVAADANPLVCGKRYGNRMQSDSMNSDNHASVGQNVLGGDGSVQWTTSPLFKNLGPAAVDNIWLPRGLDGVERLEFSQLREDPFEVFLCQ